VIRDLGPVWETELAIHHASGAVVSEFADHLVIRTPDNPQYHWGNFVLVFGAEWASDPDRCLALFDAAIPEADWVAIGLVDPPSDQQAWEQRGLEVDVLEALAGPPPAPEPLPAEYQARAFTAADWAADVDRAIAANRRSGEYDDAAYTAFIHAQSRQRQELVRTGRGAWFGAFFEGALVADVGIVVSGSRARYQDVETDADHRGRGLAAHLISVAGAWAANRGCQELVIVTESDNPAGRLYRRLGFQPSIAGAEVFRRPPR
jgi:GNAT superfamily N-acetyltransferase